MILVTGASGLLGANFVATAHQLQERLIAVSHQRTFHLSGVEHVYADLRDHRTASKLLQSFKPTWIVHCAALTNVDLCEAHRKETWRVNVEMSHHIAAAARRVGAGMVYISTDSVFDGKAGNYSEADVPRPVNVYAKCKLAGERVVQEELEQSLIVRTNIYGWNMQEKLSLAEWVLDRLEASQPVPGFHDVIFTPILVNDLSQIILDMMKLQLRGLYHVAGSQPCSKYEFAVNLATVFGLNSKLVEPESVASSNLRAPRPKITSLQTAKVSEALGRQMPDVRSGLKNFKALRDSGFVRQLKGFRGAHHGGN